MTATLFSSDLLRRLRRSVLMSGVLFLSLTAGICDDEDDDDDNGTGPSADCIEDIDFSGTPFNESDAEPIGLNDSESGSITDNDVEVDFGEIGVFFYDIYVYGAEESGDVTVEVDPGASFDADLTVLDDDFIELDYQNEGGDGAVETSLGEADEGACYIILVSSSDAEAEGSYVLSLEAD